MTPKPDSQARSAAYESARAKLAAAEERGPLFGAVVRGEGCCQINDPEYDRALWERALAEYERLRQIEDLWLVAAEAYSTGDYNVMEDALLG